nr:unnamed protein product [Spirometra erinaceieuropaei]
MALGEMPEVALTSGSEGEATDSSSTIPGCASPVHTGHRRLFNTQRQSGPTGPQQPRRRRRASMRQGLRWLMQSVAMLIGQVSELRQQQVAMMNQNQCHGCMPSSPCASSRFTLNPVGTPEQLDTITNALDEEAYRHQLVTYLSSLGGDTVVSFVDRVFGALFSEDITSFVTFYGRQQGKRPFFGTPLYNLVLEVFDHWNRGQRSDRHQLERAMKNAFKRAYDRLLKRQIKTNINNSQKQIGGAGPSSEQ